MTELVDILTPPTFNKSGMVKSRKQAWQDGDWIGTFNLWIIQDKLEPAIIYQQRSSNSSWAPNKLDVTAGGHYQAGESIKEGLREVKEELGVAYEFNNLTHLGRKLHVSPDEYGHTRNNVVDIFIVLDNRPLKDYVLETSEVTAIFSLPIKKLIQAHTDPKFSFSASGVDYQGKPKTITVAQTSFPYNWDNYHFKITLLAQRFLNHEPSLMY